VVIRTPNLLIRSHQTSPRGFGYTRNPAFADSLAVFAAPKRIGLKSHIRLVGSAGKIMFDYVIRRLNALSAGSEKPVGGLNLR